MNTATLPLTIDDSYLVAAKSIQFVNELVNLPVGRLAWLSASLLRFMSEH